MSSDLSAMESSIRIQQAVKKISFVAVIYTEIYASILTDQHISTLQTCGEVGHTYLLKY